METAIFKNSTLIIKILPFTYDDGKKPRLPRKNSKGYNLISDLNLFFNKVLNKSDSYFEINSTKFKVKIKIKQGKDKLGKADLDNYSKAILDGITSTKKVWKDDKQVDKLILKRVYVNDLESSILIKIKQIQNETKN